MTSNVGSMLPLAISAPLQVSKIKASKDMENSMASAVPLSRDGSASEIPDKVMNKIGRNMGGTQRNGGPTTPISQAEVVISETGKSINSNLYGGRKFTQYAITKGDQTLLVNFPVGRNKEGFDDTFSEQERKSVFDDLKTIFDTKSGAELIKGGSGRPVELFFFQVDDQVDTRKNKKRSTIEISSFDNQSADGSGSARRGQAAGVSPVSNSTPSMGSNTGANDNVQPFNRIESLLDSLIAALFGPESEENSVGSKIREAILNEIRENEEGQAQADEAQSDMDRVNQEATAKEDEAKETAKEATDNEVEKEESFDDDDDPYSVNTQNPLTPVLDKTDDDFEEDFNVDIVHEPESEKFFGFKQHITEEDPNDQVEVFSESEVSYGKPPKPTELIR